jgi:DNA-binding transcriptional LysR family regulator
MPGHPTDLATFDGIVRRSQPTGRVRSWAMRNSRGDEAPVEMHTRVIFSDPEAMCQAALMGLGIALLPMPFARPWLNSGGLVRVLPGWWADGGPLSLYYPSKRQLPARTRVFVEHVVAQFRAQDFAKRMLGS